MAWSTPDLSDISQVLKGILETAINNSSLPAGNIQVSCNSPDTARTSDGYCHLTLYLLHVGRDPYWRNTPVAGPRPQLNSAQPLSLNLSYLLTAWCDADFTSEQRAMSIALQAFHSQPIITEAVIAADSLTSWLPSGEFVVSIEADTIDEMSRLWQAVTVPMRLSALIRASVIFVAPAAVPPDVSPAPTVANLAVAPKPVAGATVPLLFAGSGVVMAPALPGDTGAMAAAGPMVAVAGGSLVLAGNALDQVGAADVFLSVPGTATEWQVTGWRSGTAQPGRLALEFPTAYGTPAAALPAPGLYALAVGTVAPATRSNAVPLAVAPLVTGAVYPAQLPPDSGGVYTVDGLGFSPTATILVLGTTPLTLSAALSAGTFTVDAGGTEIQFMLPSPAPAKGDYPVLIQVNGVAAAPGWVVTV